MCPSGRSPKLATPATNAVTAGQGNVRAMTHWEYATLARATGMNNWRLQGATLDPAKASELQSSGVAAALTLLASDGWELITYALDNYVLKRAVE